VPLPLLPLPLCCIPTQRNATQYLVLHSVPVSDVKLTKLKQIRRSVKKASSAMVSSNSDTTVCEQRSRAQLQKF
jgi:hypothetical protein